MLPCLIGSWKDVGGGLQMSLSGSYGLNKDALEMPELITKPWDARHGPSTWYDLAAC